MLPRSTRRLLDSQERGSLEDITLHPQFGDVLAELVQLGAFINGETFGLAALDAVLVHPVSQRSRVHPEISCYLRHRLTGFPDNPHRPLTKLGAVLPALRCHENSS